MSADTFRLEVLLPTFQEAFTFCKKAYPDLEPPKLLNHAWEMSKKVHFHMTSRDKSFLFKCVC